MPKDGFTEQILTRWDRRIRHCFWQLDGRGHVDLTRALTGR